MYKETLRQTVDIMVQNKSRRGRKMRKRKRGKGREGRQRKTRWKMWSRKRGIEEESEQRGAETEKKGGGMNHR